MGRTHPPRDRRTRTEFNRSVLWLASCAYVSLSAAAAGIFGALIATVMLGLVFFLSRGAHL